jgi:alkylresorcinol/alkylpyrone synthase
LAAFAQQRAPMTATPSRPSENFQLPVAICGVALAYPPHRFSQADIQARAAKIFGRDGDLVARMVGTYANAGVAQRASCVPLDWYETPHGWPERMRLFEENALALLADAARRAIAQAQISPGDIALTVLVSSTGIATPSLDSRLQAPLGLAPHVQRLPIFGLGCAGGTIGLSRAAALARTLPGKYVLFLCVELCGLTFRASDTSKANIVGTALFGDGAAALVLGLPRVDKTALALVGAGGEHTWPETQDIMGWRIEDDGLGVVFSRDIPALVRARMRAASDAFLAANGLALDDIAGLLAHPGGEKVVQALESVYGFALDSARAVLRAHGNMSAVTVLAVLDETIRRGAVGRHLMLSLGPGFSAAFALVDFPDG